MKKLFILFLLAVSATVNATTVADNDTLTILKPQKVRIITGDSIQKVKVYGRENDGKYTYESKILLVDSNYVSETNINKDTWNFDFVKVGPYVERLGGLDHETTNQRLYKVENGKELVDITSRFWKKRWED